MANTTRRKRPMTRAQLAALAAGNPRVAERMREGHYEHRLGTDDDSDPTILDTHKTGMPKDQAAEREPVAGRHPGAQQPPGGWPQDATATAADLAEIDGELHLILWADGADEEHPTIAIPLSAPAERDLRDAARQHSTPQQHPHQDDDQDDDVEEDDDLDVEEADGGVLEVEPVEIYGYDMDRTRKRERTLWGLGPADGELVLDEHEQPGRVDLELVDAHDRQVLVRLSAGQADFIGKWLKPPDGLAALPEFAINADGDELRHTQGPS